MEKPKKKKLYTEEEIEAIYRKAFFDARKDLEETNVYNTEQKAKEMSENKLREMLSIVDFNHIISIDPRSGILFLGTRRATDLELTNLKAEAEALEQFTLWKVLHETPKQLAHETLFVKSESLVDLQKGKSMLYVLSNQQKVINMLKGYTPKK